MKAMAGDIPAMAFILLKKQPSIVGEDSILPRGINQKYCILAGRIRTKLDIYPFNQTLRQPTWREANSLPYSGWAFHFTARLATRG